MLFVRVVATTAGVGRVENGEIAVLDLPFPHAGALLEDTGSLMSATTCPVRTRLPLADTPLLAPLGSPRAIWGVGLNYHSKATQTGRRTTTEPILPLTLGGCRARQLCADPGRTHRRDGLRG